MSKYPLITVDRRRLLLAALAGGSSAALSSCGSDTGPDGGNDDIWAGFDDTITERTLAEAEKLFGIRFTAEERRQALRSADDTGVPFFKSQVAILEKRRQHDIPMSLQPALIFDPRLPGVDYATQRNRVVLAAEPGTDLPGDPADIAFASVKHQAQWLASGKLSSRELTDIYLDRIARYGDLLQCFITVTPEIARAQAEQADRERAKGRVRGPLHGIPYGVKDLLDTKDIATTWGAAPYKDRVATADGAVVRKMQDAGAVMLGKTALGALAWGDVWFGGETRNPWDPKEGSSGSSAGSGSATAAALCSFAIGTETLGSIVSPSDRCGLAGLRPTFGRVSRVGAMALCWSLDKIGPMCRYVEDTALVLDALNGYDAFDASSIDFGFEYDGNAPLDKFVIGYDPSWFEGDDVSGAEKSALRAAGQIGATLRELRLPELPVDQILPPVNVESAAAFEELTLSGRDDLLRRQIDAAWPNNFRQSRYFSAVDYVQADRLRRSVMQQMHEFLSGVDVVIGPSLRDDMLTITNYTGHPSLTLRAGFDELTPRPLFGHPENESDRTLHRVPRSITLWSPLFEERQLLCAGRALEQLLGVADERPPLT